MVPRPQPAETPILNRFPAPWQFAVLILPQGIYLGFLTTVLPFLLRNASVPVDVISRISSLLSIPWVLCFLWTPLVDVKLRRRIWLLIAAVFTALSLSVSLILASTGKITPLCLAGLAGGMAASLVLVCCGSLMVTTLPSPAQGKASAWYEAGKLGGSALAAALLLWLLQFLPAAAGLIAVCLTVAPALLALTIKEAPVEIRPWFKGRIREIAQAVHTVVVSPTHRVSVLLLASPVGTGAAIALLPAVARDYGVGADGVIWANGLGGGVVLALGSLSGTLLPGNMDRRLSYAGAGLLNALAALILLQPNRAVVYYVGTILYLATAGLCWARYSALVAEVMGGTTRNVGILYSVLIALGNLPLVYMVWADGWGFKQFGTCGLFGMDASGNIVVVAIAMLAFFFRRATIPATGSGPVKGSG